MTDNAKKILDNIMQEITAEKAVSFIRQRVFSDGVNIPCKSWSYLNQFVTYLSGTYDARGFLQWKEAGRQVKKGVKAIYILVPMLYKVKDNNSDDGAEGKKLTGFKAMPVFRLEDTEGAELDYFVNLKTFAPDSLPLIDIAHKLNINVTAGLTWDSGGWFRPADNSITMGSNSGQVFLHELSHAVDNVLPDKNSDYAFNEVVAELSAAFLCKVYDVECSLDNTTAYIKSWKGQARSVFSFISVMERVEQIFHYIEDVKTSIAA